MFAINSQYVGKQLLNAEEAERTDEAFWEKSTRARAKQYDVIMNSTGLGTIGRTNCLLHTAKTIVDNHITIIRVDDKALNPIYLAVFLNSRLGLLQTNKWQSGSSGQLEIYPSNIASFLIYLPSHEFQEQIARLVEQAYHARQNAITWLNQAKATIEVMITSKVEPSQ